MKTVIKYPFFLIFLLFFYPSKASTKTITISTFDWCPFICPSNPEYPGLLVEYTEAIYSKAGYHVEFTEYPWSRAIRNTEIGVTDALLAPALNEAPNLIFPKSEIGTQRFCFFNLKDASWLYQSPDSVIGKTILYPQDALPVALEQYHDKANLIKMAYTQNYLRQSIKMLELRRIDASLMTYYSMTYYLTKNDLLEKIKSSGCISSQKLYLAFSPIADKKDKVKQLVATFDEVIQELKKEQYFEKLLLKYELN